MENHLERIRGEQPNLNPAEVYSLLFEAVKSSVLEEEIDFEAFLDSLEQYTDRLDDLHAAMMNKEKPRSAGELLEQTVGEWLEALKSDQQDLDSFYEELDDIACNIPDKEYIEEKVEERIREEYPQFHKEYLEHRKWLEINAERIARQERGQLQDEADQTRSQDGRAR